MKLTQGLVRLTLALSLTAVAGGTATADAAPRFQRLGTDPVNDGPPSLDITYLDVARVGKDLHIRIGLANILPAVRSIPELPGVEWIFDVGGRTFIAEAVPGTNPRFFLFEDVGGSFMQLENPTGTYEPGDGYAAVIVPLKTIGARRGMRISGTGPRGTEDVDAHVHGGPQTLYPDAMATTKDYVIR